MITAQVNPYSLFINNAGGKATSRDKNSLDSGPDSVSRIVPVAIGGIYEIDLFLEYIKKLFVFDYENSYNKESNKSFNQE